MRIAERRRVRRGCRGSAPAASCRSSRSSRCCWCSLAVRQPDFLAPPSLMSFLGRSAPIILLAAGQYFVIVSGEFDLSVGSLVTAQVVVAARLIDSDPSRTWPVVAAAARVRRCSSGSSTAWSPRGCGCRRSSPPSACS